MKEFTFKGFLPLTGQDLGKFTIEAKSEGQARETLFNAFKDGLELKLTSGEDDYYPITSLCKEDISGRAEERKRLTKKLQKQIKKLTPEEMKYWASKMADVFLDGDYWFAVDNIIDSLEEEK